MIELPFLFIYLFVSFEYPSIRSDAELPTAEEDLHQMQDTLEKEKERLHLIRMQLAKKNRAIVSIERKLDNIPDRTELAQYQRRFVELYSQGKLIDAIDLSIITMIFIEFRYIRKSNLKTFIFISVSAKHRETKQYFTLYNTLNDTKQYLTKELSLLNSIYENYAEYVNVCIIIIINPITICLLVFLAGECQICLQKSSLYCKWNKLLMV